MNALDYMHRITSTEDPEMLQKILLEDHGPDVAHAELEAFKKLEVALKEGRLQQLKLRLDATGMHVVPLPGYENEDPDFYGQNPLLSRSSFPQCSLFFRLPWGSL